MANNNNNNQALDKIYQELGQDMASFTNMSYECLDCGDIFDGKKMPGTTDDSCPGCGSTSVIIAY